VDRENHKMQVEALELVGRAKITSEKATESQVQLFLTSTRESERKFSAHAECTSLDIS